MTNSPGPLSKTLQGLAMAEIVIGTFIIILQFSVDVSDIATYVDWYSTGIWGGIFMISAGSSVQRRARPRSVSVLAVIGLLSSITLISVYSWSISVIEETKYGCYYYQGGYYYGFSQNGCDWRKAVDIMFIILGIMGFFVNIFLIAKAKDIPPPPVRTFVVAPPVNRNAAYMTSGPVVYTVPPPQTVVVYQQNQQPGAYVQQQQHTYPPQPPPAYSTQIQPGYPNPPGWTQQQPNQQQAMPTSPTYYT